MKIYLLFLALLPVSCFMIWIYYKDRYEKEPPKTLLKYFLLGILDAPRRRGRPHGRDADF